MADEVHNLGSAKRRNQTLKKAEADRDELRASLQSAMKNAWQGMVSPTIQKLISELQAEVNKLNAKKTEVQASHTILSEMEKAISDHHCEVCDQNLTDEWAHHLQMKLDDLKSSHPALTEDERKVTPGIQLSDFKQWMD